MPPSNEVQLNALLQGIAKSLDIPPGKYAQAVEQYKAVGDWLSAEGTALAGYSPEVYPQGSLRLGTIVRPLRDGEESDYDVDLVCQLDRVKDSSTPADIKQSVGARLCESEKYKRMLAEEGKRCWTLQYAE
ncbi:MAG: nucleotidyltransferase, partial [Verrucomicrobia bacterium]|nr:nucleotidyltransferase [Verrucomicrobiota bacterium]